RQKRLKKLIQGNSVQFSEPIPPKDGLRAVRFWKWKVSVLNFEARNTFQRTMVARGSSPSPIHYRSNENRIDYGSIAQSSMAALRVDLSTILALIRQRNHCWLLLTSPKA